MTTIRDAQSAVSILGDRVYDLDKAIYAIALKGDHIDLDRHLEQLQIARVSKLRALEELQAVRGRVPIKPVRLSQSSSPPHPSVAVSQPEPSPHSSLTLKSIDSERR